MAAAACDEFDGRLRKRESESEAATEFGPIRPSGQRHDLARALEPGQRNTKPAAFLPPSVSDAFEWRVYGFDRHESIKK